MSPSQRGCVGFSHGAFSTIFMLLVHLMSNDSDGERTARLVARRRARRFVREMRYQTQLHMFRRRRSRFYVMLMVSILYSSSRIVDPDGYKMPTYHTWWEECVLPHFPDREWLRNFRMKRATFQQLCQDIQPALPVLVATNFRKPITTEKRVAICIWRMATPCEFRTLGHLFGVGRSTACKIVHEVVAAIIDTIYRRYIQWPKGDDLLKTLKGFEVYRGMPQCAGAIDGTHIQVSPPEDYQSDFLNRKGFHSINLQAVCDYRLRFTDIYVGWVGRAHDARVFRHSKLFELGEEHGLFPLWTKEIGNCHIPIFIVGDPAYPIQDWLMKAFPESANLTREQRRFNYLLSRARIIIEMAFGQLKGRWRCLGKKNESSVVFIPALVTACCALHNYCIDHGDLFNQRYLDLPLAFADFEAPVEQLPLVDGVPWDPADAEIDLPSPAEMRNALATYFARR